MKPTGKISHKKRDCIWRISWDGSVRKLQLHLEHFPPNSRYILYRRDKVNWRIRGKTNELKQSPPVNYVWDKSNFETKFTVTYFSACILIRGRVHFMLEKCFHMWTQKFSFYSGNICVVVALLNKKKNPKKELFSKRKLLFNLRRFFRKLDFSWIVEKKNIPLSSNTLFSFLVFYYLIRLDFTNFVKLSIFYFQRVLLDK